MHGLWVGMAGMDPFGVALRLCAANEEKAERGREGSLCLACLPSLPLRPMLIMLILRLPGALLVAGPPCSLFVYMAVGTHLRSLYGMYGDTSLRSVRMANAIARNFATRLCFICAVLP